MKKHMMMILLPLFVFFLSTPAFSGKSPEIELAKARTIVELDNKLKAAIAAMISPPAGANAEALKTKMKELQDALDQAVKDSYGLTTSEGVKHAYTIVETKKLIDDLEHASAQKGISPTTQSALTDAQNLVETRLKDAISETSETVRLKNLADQRFAGFNFGVALGVTIKAGKRDIVNSASLDANGIVRVDRDNDTTANLILESHYFFTPDGSIWNVEPKNWGIGPYVAIQPGTNNIIQSVGAGLMIGFKRSSIIAQDLARDRGDSFNLGFGVMLNPNAQVLGDGIQKDQRLPAGETTIRTKTTTELGYLITFSYSF